MKPIDLLDLLTRVNAAAQTPGEEHADLAEQFAQVMADPATADALAELRAQAEALAAEREQVSLYRLDNDGHMECLAETYRDLLRY